MCNASKSLAKILNAIFHPLLMPLYIMMIIFKFNHLMGHIFTRDMMGILLIFVAVTAVLIPALSFFFLKRSKFYSVTEKQQQQWNAFLLLFIALIYCAIYKSFMRIGVPLFISKLFILNALLVVLASIFSLFVDIDLHSIAIGELIGLYIRFLHLGMSTNDWLLMLMIIVAGIVGCARLRLHEKLSLQYHLGVLVGGGFVFFLYV